ncbi:MAG: M3 family oligoendopeptidase [Flavobacteriales bacterium]|nr:M3 family oligoendopeptidase [Flavobacteriales bacterium]
MAEAQVLDIPVLLPDRASAGSLEAIRSAFERLDRADIDRLEPLKRWLLERSELEASVSQEEAVRYIRTTLDTADIGASEAYQEFALQVRPEIERWNDRLNRKLVASPALPELEKEEGYRIYLRTVRGQLELFREENVILLAELRELGQRYGEIMGAVTISHDGREITAPEAAALLETTDRQLRETVFRKLAERRAVDRDRLDALFQEMVAKRHQVALNAGEVDFRDYMYKALGRFDHDPKDAMAFHDSVVQEVVPVVAELESRRRADLGLEVLRPWDLAVDPDGRPPLRPFKHSEELLDFAVQVFRKVDPSFAEDLEIMQRMGALDLACRKGKAPGGYNYPLYLTGVPFIFMNAVGTHDDLVTMMHEGGHAVHSFLSHPLPLTGQKQFPSEVAELASMTMELLTMDHWHLVYEREEDLRRAKRDQLERVITVLPWVAAVDAFQHQIYTERGLPAQAIHELWTKTHERFSTGVVDWTDLEEQRATLWHKQLHIFEVPFYYIEYAIAQLGALGVWTSYRKDPLAAIDKFKQALSLGYTRTLPEIYEAAGTRFDLGQQHIRSLMAVVMAEWRACGG